MEIKKIDGIIFKTLVLNGADNLKANYQVVDALNVFPVPDGDTGTNMRMTVEGGVHEIYNFEDSNIEEMAKKLSRGMLMGARGNSGVILSQFFRGIFKGFSGVKEVNAMGLAKAFDSGVKQAYKAVMKPVEGTILTVCREASEKMVQIANSRMTIHEFFVEFIEEAKASLNRTPELLPVLKEAGVVDSGGAGFIYIIEGMLLALEGKTVVVEEAKEEKEKGYNFDTIIKLNDEKTTSKEVKATISSLGTSITVICDRGLVKVHMSTLEPGDVINTLLQFGIVMNLKVENLSACQSDIESVEAKKEEDEVVEAPVRPTERKKYAVVSVASGEGLINLFKEMGADYIVTGGQTMNPSTEDFIKGFDTLNADHILVFPNNKNIVLAAKQAAKIYTESKVHIVDSKTIAQGFSSLTMLDLSGEPEEILESLNEVIENCTTATITYAVRDTSIDGINIKKNDFMGFKDGKIIASCKSRYDAVRKLLRAAITEEKEIVTVIYGADVKEKDAMAVKGHIERHYENVEVDVINGGQDVYSFIFSIE